MVRSRNKSVKILIKGLAQEARYTNIWHASKFYKGVVQTYTLKDIMHQRTLWALISKQKAKVIAHEIKFWKKMIEEIVALHNN